MNELAKEFQSFCDRYIEAAENEWAKTDNQVDLAAATVGKIMINKFNEILSRHEKDTEPPLMSMDTNTGEISPIMSKHYKCPKCRTRFTREYPYKPSNTKELQDTEPLACLALKKGYDRTQYDFYANDNTWSVYFSGYKDDDYIESEIYGPTYPEAEAKAREYLETLEDK